MAIPTISTGLIDGIAPLPRYDVRKRILVIKKFCAGEISRSDAMSMLGSRCHEELYAAIIGAGFDLPRQSVEDALESSAAAMKLLRPRS